MLEVGKSGLDVLGWSVGVRHLDRLSHPVSDIEDETSLYAENFWSTRIFL